MTQRVPGDACNASVKYPAARRGGEMLAMWGLMYGLAFAAYGSSGPAAWVFRAALAVLAGRALAAGGVGAAGTRRRPHAATILYMVVIWAATFSPNLLGNPDVVRSSAAAAAVVVCLRGLPGKVTLALAAALIVTGVAATGMMPHAGVLGTLEHALGATWPRDLGDVSAVAGLFLLGSAWAKTPQPVQGL